MTDDLPAPPSPHPAEPISLEYVRGPQAPLVWPYHVAFWTLLVPLCSGIFCLLACVVTRLEFFASGGMVVLMVGAIAWPVALVFTCVYLFQGPRIHLDLEVDAHKGRLVLLLLGSPIVAVLCVFMGGLALMGIYSPH